MGLIDGPIQPGSPPPPQNKPVNAFGGIDHRIVSLISALNPSFTQDQVADMASNRSVNLILYIISLRKL